jgi:DNA (cytosine-5)-methyltransferase 1
MARVVDELAAAGAVVIEWATLDAQWFGVPQRRRRVFIASCFNPATADRCPDPLFPVGKSSIGNPEESEPAGEDTATDVGTGVAFGASSFGGFTEDVSCLRATNARESMLIADTVGPLTQKSMTLRGSETTDSHHVIPVVFDPSRRDGARIQDDTTNTLTGHMGTGGNNTPMVAQPMPTHDVVGTLQTRSPGTNHEGIRDGQLIPTISTTMTFDTQFGSNANVFDDMAPTLKASQQAPSVAQPIPIQDGRDIEKHQNRIGIAQPGDPAYTLDTTGGQAVAQPNLAVRRLTPIECERLMGWPDDHTLHRADGKTNADSTRYKMCGNGVASPVATWIAKHLKGTM